MNIVDFHILLPEILVLAMAALVLVIGLFSGRKQSSISYTLSQISLLISVVFVWNQIGMPTLYALHNMFILDAATTLSKLMILICAIFSLAYAKPFFNENPEKTHDYCLLFLFSVSGMMMLVSSNHLIPMYLSLELLSLPLYALVTIQRTGMNAEAGMKYFAMGAFASALLLYGISLVYGATASLSLSTIANSLQLLQTQYSTMALIGLVFIVAGLAFKFGAAPFHQWSPDIYQGAPTPVITLLGSAPKIAVLIMAIRLFSQSFVTFAAHWQMIWIAVAIASMALGNIAAIIQNNLRRMLAYSSIAHMGYMLLGFVTQTPGGNAAALFYVFAYALMTLAGFGALIVASNQGFEVENIEDLRGLNSRSPWIAFMILIVMFSLAGIPPSVGFFAKVGVLEAVMSVHMTWLAVLALIFAIIGCYYYIRVVKAMYFEPVEDASPLYSSWGGKVILSLNSLIILLLGIFPSSLIDLCRAVYFS
ncbi:MAG: nuoN [Gammaproteobacteria bacterium]|jgi:NADH-quinone oxidoreductase subunit N|nr:nuoN [Gammaproteobacteria bacterium]